MIDLRRQRAARVSQRAAGEDLEQQLLGEGKCPITYYVLLTS
jgi:hypothetical protein